MPKRVERYSAEQLDFLREGFVRLRVAELTQEFNQRFDLERTPVQIKTTLRNHRMRCGRKGGHLPGSFRLLTQEQAQFVAEAFAQMPVVEVAAALNLRFGTEVTVEQIKSFTKNHRVLSGRTGQFVPGGPAWNKGVKGYMGANCTSFAKGSMPHTKRPLWSERVNRDGFIEISVPERNPYTGAPTRFKHKHVWLWEASNGPVPKGHAVIFIDGDKSKCTMENLMLVTRAELLAMNLHGYREQPDELKASVLALAKLETKAKIRTRPGRGRKKRKGQTMKEATP